MSSLAAEDLLENPNFGRWPRLRTVAPPIRKLNGEQLDIYGLSRPPTPRKSKWYHQDSGYGRKGQCFTSTFSPQSFPSEDGVEFDFARECAGAHRRVGGVENPPCWSASDGVRVLREGRSLIYEVISLRKHHFLDVQADHPSIMAGFIEQRAAGDRQLDGPGLGEIAQSILS